MTKIKIAIAGYGNLGKACEALIKKNDNFELIGIFSRRSIKNTISLTEIENYKEKIDVLLVCVGSSIDAPTIVPQLATHFNTVDSFDTHAVLEQYINSIQTVTQKSQKTAIVATGWDPGLFSILRIYFDSFSPISKTQTFWGSGVSLGHSNAIKEIKNVEDAIQFTIPIKEAISKAKKGLLQSSTEKHKRICYVVAPETHHLRIEQEIKNMPNYFEGYQTDVIFVSKNLFEQKFKNRKEHAGLVLLSDDFNKISFQLKLKSNPRFTAQVMLAYAIANYKLHNENKTGVFTVADIPPKYLTNENWLEKI